MQYLLGINNIAYHVRLHIDIYKKMKSLTTPTQG